MKSTSCKLCTLIWAGLLFMFPKTAFPQTETIYEQSFLKISSMIDGDRDINFKEAVFVVENAFYDGEKNYNAFSSKIRSLAGMAYSLRDKIDLDYDEPDSAIVKTYAALWSIMTDTLSFDLGSGVSLVSKPYLYDFNDVFGQEDWSQMFVSKLLTTRTGNCHSLPYLYKILAEELGETAHLALAPNHIYIKHYSKKTGWYNTELTSASFPIDAWLTASGYIHLDAIRNGVYMDTLSQQESLALTLIDLAKGYERKFGIQDGAFMLKAANKALEVDPNFINALLLKAETQKKLFEDEMLLRSIDDPNTLIEQSEEHRNLFLEMQSIYVKIHHLGYRQMPQEMYLDWLSSLQEERERYQNKDIPATQH
ncbi:MAG: hypothetical protein AAFW89_07365 [Bacteroidota bacterium]